MIALTFLRPTDGTPAATAAALDRSLTAGRAALATMERIKAERAALLLAGQPSSKLDENSAQLARASEDAVQIGHLIGELQRELDKAVAGQSAEKNAAVASLAFAEMANWVAQNSETLVQGVHLLGTVFRALAPQPASERSAASNVVPMTPRPGAA